MGRHVARRHSWFVLGKEYRNLSYTELADAARTLLNHMYIHSPIPTYAEYEFNFREDGTVKVEFSWED